LIFQGKSFSSSSPLGYQGSRLSAFLGTPSPEPMDIVAILFNSELLKLYGEDGVAAYGVVLYISYIFLAVFLGYSISMNPVVGCNYGSKNRKEIRNILIKSLVLNAITGAAMTAVAEGCASVFSEVFVGYDSGLRSLTTTALRLYSLCFIFSGINIFASSFFTGLNDGLDSAVISFSRSWRFICYRCFSGSRPSGLLCWPRRFFR